jgi:predicted transcriptional regulator
MSSRTYTDWRSQYRVLQILDALDQAPSTSDQLAELMPACQATAIKTLRLMRDAKIVYIKRWVGGNAGRYKPVYAIGNRPDKPEPKMTTAARFVRLKANTERYELHKHKQNSRYRLRVVRKTPQTWMSALL